MPENKPFDLQRRDHGFGADPGNLGFPQIRAENLIPPTEFVLVESATLFRELFVPRAVRLYVPSQKRIFRAVPLRLKYDGAKQISLGLFAPSFEGFIELAPGTWQINTPIVAAEGTQITAIYHDASFAIPSFSSDAGTLPATTPGAASVVTAATAASGVVVAAGTRRVTLSNPPSGVDVWLAFGAEAAVVGEGIGLFPGETLELDERDGVQLGVNGRADGADQALGRQIWT